MLEQAALFKEELLAALALSCELEVDFSGVRPLALSALQLLCASHQSAEKQGKRFKLMIKDSKLCSALAADAGLQRVAWENASPSETASPSNRPEQGPYLM
jgi:hypothetical protein